MKIKCFSILINVHNNMIGMPGSLFSVLCRLHHRLHFLDFEHYQLFHHLLEYYNHFCSFMLYVFLSGSVYQIHCDMLQRAEKRLILSECLQITVLMCSWRHSCLETFVGLNPIFAELKSSGKQQFISAAVIVSEWFAASAQIPVSLFTVSLVHIASGYTDTLSWSYMSHNAEWQ